MSGNWKNVMKAILCVIGVLLCLVLLFIIVMATIYFFPDDFLSIFFLYAYTLFQLCIVYDIEAKAYFDRKQNKSQR